MGTRDLFDWAKTFEGMSVLDIVWIWSFLFCFKLVKALVTYEQDLGTKNG